MDLLLALLVANDPNPDADPRKQVERWDKRARELNEAAEALDAERERPAKQPEGEPFEPFVSRTEAKEPTTSPKKAPPP
jgi:hypothetical protein